VIQLSKPPFATFAQYVAKSFGSRPSPVVQLPTSNDGCRLYCRGPVAIVEHALRASRFGTRSA
jgi:hypothetical protein